MVLTPRIGEDFVGWKTPSGSDETLAVVDFSIFPHVDHPDLPENTMAHAERWASGPVQSGIRNRRQHRDKGGRRHRRVISHGALEERPQSGSKRIPLGDGSRSLAPGFRNDP